jgi:hypothetical protein
VSKSSKRTRRPERLPESSLGYLDAGLRAVQHAPNHAHSRRVERLAITYRPCQRGSDRLPEARIPYDQFRLLSLSHRWCERSGAVAKVVVLGAYTPVVNLPGSGRITFVCDGVLTVGRLGGRLVPDPRNNLTASRAAVLMAQEVEDADQADLVPGLVFPEFYYAFDPSQPPVFETNRPIEDWREAEVKIGNLRAWPIAYFARPAQVRWDQNPVDGSTDPWVDATEAVEEGAIRGTWILRDGVATPLAQEPREILADLSGLVGRSVRNPAWHVLRKHKVIQASTGYRQWLEGIAPYTGDHRDAPDADDPASEAGKFRSALALAVDQGEGDALIEDVANACLAAGVPIPVDEEEAYEFLAGLLEDPWLRPEVPGVAAIQRVRLTGLPDPSTMTFSSGVLEVNLHDLGEYTEQFAQLPAGRVAEALEQTRRGSRRAKPWRKATI